MKKRELVSKKLQQPYVFDNNGKKQWGIRGRNKDRNINDWEDDRQDRALAYLEKVADSGRKW